MPQALDNFIKAAADLREATALLGLIGKESPGTTARTPGRLHAADVSVTVCYQEHDGGKNYHECKVLDRAMSTVLRRHYFDRLTGLALQELERAVSETRDAAEAEYRQMFDAAIGDPPREEAA